MGFASKWLDNIMVRLNRYCLYDRFDVEISKLLESEYMEVVPEDEIHDDKQQLWFLPHHCVINLNN